MVMKFGLRKIITLLLIPFVLYGLYFLYSEKKAREVYAEDPLIVTIDGVDATLEPMFELFDMKPGDEVERCFEVKNSSPDSISVVMTGLKKEEDKNFSEILDIEIYDSSSLNIIFSGILKDFLESFPYNLGNFNSGSERKYCIFVKFPESAGNEYQKALLVFDVIWKTELPDLELPPECEHLRGKITKVVEGTEGNDRLHGSISNELILAYGGNDRIDASSGADCIVAGDGDDRVDSESGNDVILAGGGNDRVKSGSGNDKVWGGEGNDDINLGTGDDLAYGEAGEDNIDGGNDNDEIYGGFGNDTLRGGSGNDKLYGEEGDDYLRGNSGDDILDGGSETDKLKGNSGTDTCIDGEDNSSCEI